MSVSDILQQKLTEQFAPLELEITDESYKHRGHAGFKPEGETHFKIRIVSGVFEGKSRVERQRMVHDVLKEELSERIHALSLFLQTPEENSPKNSAAGF